MAEIISISTAVPQYCHRQKDIIDFMAKVYGIDDTEKRKLAFLYNHSGIETRYSVINDYSLPAEQWDFIPSAPQHEFPSLETRMKIFEQEALPLCRQAVENCLQGFILPQEITHIITVTCTGMSAPGLDLQLAEALQLSPNVFRTSVNFMGCYAAVHALKLAQMICGTNANAYVLIVDIELCTLHFQKEYTPDNAASSLLFADGAAAVLVSNKKMQKHSLHIDGFHSAVAFKGKRDMAWELSSKGFLMTLSGYIPHLIEEDIGALVEQALQRHQLSREDITHWCIHPGGRKIVDVIQEQLELTNEELCFSRKILKQYGNMSSPTILFVLKEMMRAMQPQSKVFGVAFGPG
ncbi:MAG TPA: type III polyketide synthase, partial [Chitinophagaceae bacterium]|nr:type III polyketide synthase [Chitinophagaceae bacterium]